MIPKEGHSNSLTPVVCYVWTANVSSQPEMVQNFEMCEFILDLINWQVSWERRIIEDQGIFQY